MLAPWGTELQPFLRICTVGPLHMAGFLPVAVSLHQVLLALSLSPEPLHTLMVLWQPAQFWPALLLALSLPSMAENCLMFTWAGNGVCPQRMITHSPDPVPSPTSPQPCTESDPYLDSAAAMPQLPYHPMNSGTHPNGRWACHTLLVMDYSSCSVFLSLVWACLNYDTVLWS